MNLLKGKKTYLTAGAAIIFALVLFFLGQLGGTLTTLFIFGVALAAFLRQGINDLSAKISGAQDDKKET
jgi:ABC-type Fe3+-siderophore transport system permease subunit